MKTLFKLFVLYVFIISLNAFSDPIVGTLDKEKANYLELTIYYYAPFGHIKLDEYGNTILDEKGSPVLEFEIKRVREDGLIRLRKVNDKLEATRCVANLDNVHDELKWIPIEEPSFYLLNLKNGSKQGLFSLNYPICGDILGINPINVMISGTFKIYEKNNKFMDLSGTGYFSSVSPATDSLWKETETGFYLGNPSKDVPIYNGKLELNWSGDKTLNQIKRYMYYK